MINYLLWEDDLFEHKTVNSGLKYRIIFRDKSICQLCLKKISLVYHKNGLPYLCYGYGKSPFHIDHIKQKIEGGKNTLNNLRLTCARCNMKRRKIYAKS